MTQEEKNNLFMKQKQLIILYREESQREMSILQNRLAQLNDHLNNLRKNNDIQSQSTNPLHLKTNPILSMPMYRSRMNVLHDNKMNLHFGKPKSRTPGNFSKLGSNLPNYRKRFSKTAMLFTPNIHQG